MKVTVFTIMMLLPCIFINGISLEEAVGMALRNNLELKQSYEEVLMADETYRDVRSNILPQLSFNAGYNISRTEIPQSSLRTAMNITGELTPQASEDEEFLAGVMENFINSMIPDKKIDEVSLAGQLKFDQVLYLGGKLVSGIRAADRYRSFERYRYELKRQDLIMKTIELYYSFVLAQKVYEIKLDAYELAQAHFSRVESFFGEGLVSEYEVISAELEVAKLRPELRESQRNYEIIKESFKKHIGFEEGEFNVYEETEIPLFDKVLDERFYSDSLNRRTEIRIAKLHKEMLELQLKAERGNYLPDVVLSAEYNKFSATDDFSIKSDNFGTSYQIGIGLRIPLFTGFSNSSKISRARHELRQSELALRDIFDKLELDIRNSYLELRQYQEQLKTEEKRIALAERGLEIARSRYENQLGIQLEVFDSQLHLRSAQLSSFNTRYNYLISYYRLEKSLGNDLIDIIEKNNK